MKASVWCGLAGLGVLWAFSAFAAGIARRFIRSEESARVCLRVKTWFYIIAVFAGLFVLPVYGVFIVFALVALATLREIWTAVRPGHSERGFAAALCLSVLTAGSLFCACVLYVRGKEIFFFAVVLTQLNDIFQYLCGKGFGRRAILPKISPSKTWGGFWGGVACSASAAYWAGPYFWSLSGWRSFVAGGLLSVFGFLGDATVSAFKRRVQIKDLGTSLPGHGGILDRIDSLLYVFLLVSVYWGIFLKQP